MFSLYSVFSIFSHSDFALAYYPKLAANLFTQADLTSWLKMEETCFSFSGIKKTSPVAAHDTFSPSLRRAHCERLV